MFELLRIENLGHHYGSKAILNDFNLQLHQGECLSLLGASGCGKTSVLRAVAGLLNPTRGKIYLSGKPVFGPSLCLEPQRRKVGLVFQDYALFPNLTVTENIAFGLHGRPSDVIAHRCMELLELTRLAEHANKRPAQLSGGQQQRVALARALAPKPELLLLDEPFANIDSNLKASLGQALKEILVEESATVLLVTHDRNDALALSDRIAIMNISEEGGFVEQVGTPETVYRRPSSRSAALLTGEALVFDAVASRGKLMTAYGAFDSLDALDGDVEIIERPESFAFRVDPEGLFELTGIHFYGGSRKAMIVHDAERWIVPCPPNAQAGDRVAFDSLRPLWSVPR